MTEKRANRSYRKDNGGTFGGIEKATKTKNYLKSISCFVMFGSYYRTIQIRSFIWRNKFNGVNLQLSSMFISKNPFSCIGSGSNITRNLASPPPLTHSKTRTPSRPYNQRLLPLTGGNPWHINSRSTGLNFWKNTGKNSRWY